MQKIHLVVPLLCFAALFASGEVQAQTITVGPSGYVTAGPGGTVQLTATVTGTTGSTAVIWRAGGVTGGNATVGTISDTGLFTAPTTVPVSGMTPVTAQLASNTKKSGVQYIYLLTAGPQITSVTPNPLAVGTITVTITGNGFLTGAAVMAGPVQMSTISVTPNTIRATTYQPPAASTTFMVRNPSSIYGNAIVVPVGSGHSGGTGSTGSTSSTGSTGTTTAPGAISPTPVSVILGATQQFKSTGATSWTAVAGTITSAGLYTAPSAMPSGGTDTVTALNAAGQATVSVTLLTSVPPTVLSTGVSPLPLGIFSTTVNGTGFTAQSVAKLDGSALNTVYMNPTTLSVSGFAGPGSTASLTVSNGTLVSAPLAVAVGVQTPLVSASAARRFLEQAAFGPTPADAAHVQAIGFQAWIDEQVAMPVVSNYNALLTSGVSQGGLSQAFLTNAVNNADQLRQRVAFALSQIFTISITKIIWDGDMIPYEQMLINDSFTSYSQILTDVTLSPGMGDYLDMANNAAANPAAGTAANENYAREAMQLFSMGDVLLNQDGTPQTDATGVALPTYLQPQVSELARVFTGWTYTQPGGVPHWGSYINSSGPMIPDLQMHDFGGKTLINGYAAAAGLTMQQDLQGALNAIATHPNVAPFISKQLIQHLVKSNPSPAYVQRVAQAFSQSSGNIATAVTAILLDPEARANDEGGNDLATDGHFQEPVLFVAGFVRAFGGTMTTANYYSQTLAGLGEDIYNPASVFNYFSPGYRVPGTGGLLGPELQIDNPNAAILRENLVAEFFSQYSNPVQSNGPGTTVDLTPLLQLAATPSALMNALDLTLTHGTMPAAMKQIIANAVTADKSYGSLKQVEEAVYLILQSSYYNVWH